jgi:predicted RecA/RadA family phage recombinase
MRNFIKPGEVVTRTAPVGGVVAGNAYLIGSLLVIATGDAAAADPFEGQTVGVFSLPKDGVALAEGQRVFWDDTAKEIVDVDAAGVNKLVGCCDKAALVGDATAEIRLNGIALPVLGDLS